MFRNVLAFLSGVIVAMLIISGFEKLNLRRYPLPPGTDPADQNAIAAYVETLPKAAFLTILAGWMTGSFICGFLIRLIARNPRKTTAYIAGLFLTTAGIVDSFMIPHPLWFTITGVLLFIPFTLLGHMVHLREKSGQDPTPEY